MAVVIKDSFTHRMISVSNTSPQLRCLRHSNGAQGCSTVACASMSAYLGADTDTEVILVRKGKDKYRYFVGKSS